MITRFSSLIPHLIAASLLAQVASSARGNDLVLTLHRRIQSLAVHATGQLLVGHEAGIVRFGVDGSPETLSLRLLATPRMLAVENDGMVLSRGGATIERVDLDGALRSRVVDGVWAFLVQPDGKLVVWMSSPSGSEQPMVLSRINPDSTPDPSFIGTPLPVSFFLVLALQEDGKILAAGGPDAPITRLNRDGSRDLAFHAPLPFSQVRSMVVQSDGRIVVSIMDVVAGGEPRHELVRLNPDGVRDDSFKAVFTSGTGIDSVAMQADGKVIIAGNFAFEGGQAAPRVVRLNSDGTLDGGFAFEVPAQAPFIPLVLQGDGSILAGFGTLLVRRANPTPATQALLREGSTLTWQRSGSCPEIHHARFQTSPDGIQWSDLGAGERVSGGWRLRNASVPAGARLRMRGYVTGGSYYLDHVPGAPAIHARRLDQTVTVGTNVTFRIAAQGLDPLSIRWFRDGKPLDVPSHPTLLLSDVTGGATGEYSVTVSNSEGISSAVVGKLSVIDPVLLGHPTPIWINAGGSTNLGVRAGGTGLTYQWRKDGNDIPGATAPSLGLPKVTREATGDYQVVVTGAYGAVHSPTVAVQVNEALPDPDFRPHWEARTEWFPIQAVVVSNDVAFVGGLFRMLDASGRVDLVKLTPGGSVDTSFAPEFAGGEVGGVASLSLTPNGQLLVGGNFRQVHGQPQPHLARLNGDGTLDATFHPRIEGTSGGIFTQVTTIEILSDGRILIGGGFAAVDGRDRPGLALLSPNGQLDESFNPDPSYAPYSTWGTIVQPGARIIAYGRGYGRFLPDGTADLGFNPALGSGTIDLLPLAGGNMLVTTHAVGETVALVNRDGGLVSDFARWTGSSAEVEQADGRVVFARQSEAVSTQPWSTPSATGFSLRRMSLDGAEDPGFGPLFNGYVTIKAMRGDGSMLVTGFFSNVTGVPLPKLALVRNSAPATRTLDFDGTSARWLRSATSPEVARARFDFSADGVTWTPLGEGARIPGGWRLAGVRLGASGKLRAQGYGGGSIHDTTIDVLIGPKLEAPSYRFRDGELILNAPAHGGSRTILQASANLLQWTSLRTNSPNNPQWNLTLTNQHAPLRFFRLIPAPAE